MARTGYWAGPKPTRKIREAYGQSSDKATESTDGSLTSVKFAGEMMRPQTLLVGYAAALIHLSAWAGPVGEVTYASGSVKVGERAGAEIMSGTRIAEGEALETGGDGHLHIKLADRGLLILRPNSKAVVSDYVFDESEPSRSRMRVTVSSGVVRSITGDWAKQDPSRFRVNTPVAALGVRGTDFTLFADPLTTRASVNSGGIVVTPLGAACSAETLGPCEGAFSTELFAGDRRFVVEATATGRKPDIVDGYQLGTHPDMAASPSTVEPKPAAPDQRPHPNLRSDLDTLAASSVKVGDMADAAAPSTRRLVKWGRWESLLNPGNEDDIRIGRTRVASNAHFALYRDNSAAFVMPREGVASFRLAEQESYFHDGKTGRTLPASLENARLSVDFGKQTFATSFDVRAADLSTKVSANGGLLSDGRFTSSFISSNAAVSGALAGSNATEAGLIFKQTVTQHLTAYGATSWSR